MLWRIVSFLGDGILLHLFSEKLIKKIFEDREINIEIYTYGLELFISSVFCTLILLITGIITNSFIESILFIILFSALRIFTVGYHSNSYVMCTIITISLYITSVLSYQYLFIIISNKFIVISVFTATIFLVGLYAPVVNANKSLDQSKLLNYKIKAIVVYFLEISFYLVLYHLFQIKQISIIVPTLFSIDILIIIQVIFKGKGGIKNEISSEKGS